MKFKVNRDHFSAGLGRVLNVVGTRATIPVLSNVLIEAEEGAVALTTTNLDLAIRCKIEAEVETPGALTLPVRKLQSIVKELPSIDVEVETFDNHQAKLASGNSLFRIMGIGREEFPPMPSFDDEHSFMLDQEELARMLRSVSYAQSSDESRYLMNGVYFDFREDKLTLAATDGRRLAVISKEMSVEEDNAGELILPARTVSEVERLLGHGANVRIAFNNNQAAFEFSVGTAEEGNDSGLKDSIYLVSKVVDGKYPNYRQVIPKTTDQHIKVNRENLFICVRRAALVTTDKNNQVKLHVRPDNLEILGSSPEIGEAKEIISVEYDGPEVSVAFNPQFMLDPLRALTRDDIIFEFKDEFSPGVFRTPDSFLCVIMPLRLN